MRISEKIVRKTIEKFSDALQTCADRKYSNQGVVAFFGKNELLIGVAVGMVILMCQ